MKVLNWKLFLEELVGEKPISNLQSYIEGMNYSMRDKLFFTEMLNFDVIVDFGCADGTFLEELSKINPGVKLIGYDLDDTMLSKAKSRLGKKGLFTNDWNEAIRFTSGSKNPLLNLSSVIHEVYSYSTSNVISKFWKEQVFGGDFRYITIRDMIPSVKMDKEEINSPNNVKVIVDQQNFALYFSRSVIPFPREENVGVRYMKHIGIYAFRKQALLDFYRLPMKSLEATEKLEQLRYLEFGKRIKMVETNQGSIGIDTPEDLEKARKLI